MRPPKDMCKNGLYPQSRKQPKGPSLVEQTSKRQGRGSKHSHGDEKRPRLAAGTHSLDSQGRVKPKVPDTRYPLNDRIHVKCNAGKTPL